MLIFKVLRVLTAGKHASFEETQEEPSGYQTTVILHQTLKSRDEAKQKHACRYYPEHQNAPEIIFGRLTPNMRPQPFQDEVGRYLENDIRHKEDSQGDVEVVALELEILGQTIDGGISNIDSGQRNQVLSVSNTKMTTTTTILWLTGLERPSDTTDRAWATACSRFYAPGRARWCGMGIGQRGRRTRHGPDCDWCGEASCQPRKAALDSKRCRTISRVLWFSVC